MGSCAHHWNHDNTNQGFCVKCLSYLSVNSDFVNILWFVLFNTLIIKTLLILDNLIYPKYHLHSFKKIVSHDFRTSVNYVQIA